MQDFQKQIDQVVHNFTGQITTLAHRAAVDMVASALGKAPKSGKPMTAGALSDGEDRRPKRDETTIQEAQEKFLAFVRANPGQRIEQINHALGTTTKDLALPIRKLIASKQIRVEGQRRATTYFIRGAAEGKAKKSSTSKSKKKASKGKSSKPKARGKGKTKNKASEVREAAGDDGGTEKSE